MLFLELEERSTPEGPGFVVKYHGREIGQVFQSGGVELFPWFATDESGSTTEGLDSREMAIGVLLGKYWVWRDLDSAFRKAEEALVPPSAARHERRV